MQNVLRGRDLAAERVRARVQQRDVAAVLEVHRSVISLIENEHAPTNEEFCERYLAAVRQLAESSAA